MLWGNFFISEEPDVKLVDQIELLRECKSGENSAQIAELETLLKNSGFNTAIAAARSCYSGDLINPADVASGNLEMAERIARSIWDARHHTPYMHQSYTFRIDGISRQALWSFFHSHPFYNSEQVSQRYKKLDSKKVLVPKLTDKALEVYRAAIELQFRLYDQFRGDLLFPGAEAAYFERFPGRRNAKTEEKNKKNKLDILKKTQEIARYFAPIASHAHLYHSINFVTLARYSRLANQPDVPIELGFIIKKMVDEVLTRDPKLIDLLKSPLKEDEILENIVKQDLFAGRKDQSLVREYIKEFDSSLGEDRLSRLVSYKVNAVQEMANAVRDVLSVPRSFISDSDAIKLVLDPSYNKQRGDILTLDHTTKLARVKNIPGFTFLVKLSHTADSQAQRQRMSPAARPIFEHAITDEPDYIIPNLVRAAGEKAVASYVAGMEQIWGYRNELIKLGVPPEFANYLLPNAVAIRYRESVDLLNFMQKDEKRECLNAQEEIARITVEQRLDVERAHPELKGFFGPPCYLRKQANITPYCPEGDRYCGVPVWKGLEKDESGKVKYPQFTIEEAIRGRLI